jgi:hypothetical protein
LAPTSFLEMAGEVVRGYCQWHIAPTSPSLTTVPIQPDGTIMLPTCI